MTALRLHLGLVFLALAGYTGVVAANHGMNLLPAFFGAMAGFGWQGQFNLDFLCMLSLSGFWVARRHRFGATGLLLGACAFFGGALFLSAYLLIESYRARGDLAALLLGDDAPPQMTGRTSARAAGAAER